MYTSFQTNLENARLALSFDEKDDYRVFRLLDGTQVLLLHGVDVNLVKWKNKDVHPKEVVDALSIKAQFIKLLACGCGQFDSFASSDGVNVYPFENVGWDAFLVPLKELQDTDEVVTIEVWKMPDSGRSEEYEVLMHCSDKSLVESFVNEPGLAGGVSHVIPVDYPVGRHITEDDLDIWLKVQPRDCLKCVRCRRREQSVGSHGDFPDICTRCADVVRVLNCTCEHLFAKHLEGSTWPDDPKKQEYGCRECPCKAFLLPNNR